MALALDEPWREWAAARRPAQLLHVDTAAAGRSSSAVLAAVARHMDDEATRGAYVAEADASGVLDAGRAAVAELFSMPHDGVAFVESATAALTALLAVWPFDDGDVVAVAPSEWGPNLTALEHRGLHLRQLMVDGNGRIDVDALERSLAADRPGMVHVTHMASHRALDQPLSDIVAVCSRFDVPVWVDAAQALGHVDTASGADVVYSTGRKWMTGPRGVGVLGVAEHHWDRLRTLRRPMADGLPPIRNLESHEANVAGRVGLAAALRKHLELGPHAVHRRLREVGRTTRECLADVPGWVLVDPADATGAITAIRPTDGQDVMTARRRLLEQHGVLTTAAAVARAPLEMTEPLLRISPHVDLTEGMLAGLAAALAAVR